MKKKIARLTIIATVLLPAAVPAAAQTGVELYNGNWQSTAFTVEDGTWPDIAADGFTIAINGNNRSFEAEWTGLEPDDMDVDWDSFDVDFEASDRPGYFKTDDVPDIFDGEAQYWAFVSDEGLSIGRLQIDDDTGIHVVFVCYLTRTDDGLAADLVLSSAGPTAHAHVDLQRR